jgi:predicted  nucleic acid-binding Zn-ribbon protein
MMYEHTSNEELKEIAEREAVEMAEKEENWDQEREILTQEISALRERITSKSGMDEMTETFRAEIDALNAENSHLKQLGRERDRELADQRDKVEELTGKIGVFERERNAWTNTVGIYGKDNQRI